MFSDWDTPIPPVHITSKAHDLGSSSPFLWWQFRSKANSENGTIKQRAHRRTGRRRFWSWWPWGIGRRATSTLILGNLHQMKKASSFVLAFSLQHFYNCSPSPDHFLVIWLQNATKRETRKERCEKVNFMGGP